MYNHGLSLFAMSQRELTGHILSQFSLSAMQPCFFFDEGSKRTFAAAGGCKQRAKYAVSSWSQDRQCCSVVAFHTLTSLTCLPQPGHVTALPGLLLRLLLSWERRRRPLLLPPLGPPPHQRILQRHRGQLLLG